MAKSRGITSPRPSYLLKRRADVADCSCHSMPIMVAVASSDTESQQPLLQRSPNVHSFSLSDCGKRNRVRCTFFRPVAESTRLGRHFRPDDTKNGSQVLLDVPCFIWSQLRRGQHSAFHKNQPFISACYDRGWIASDGFSENVA